jgi:hypothetical protein
MPTEYELDEGLTAKIQSLIDNPELAEFSLLRQFAIKVEGCLKVRLDKHGEPLPSKGKKVEVKKTPAVFSLLVQPQYVVVVDYGFWIDQMVSEVHKKALLHHALMQLNVEPTTDGKKLGIRKPDVIEFAATAKRYGAWTSELATFRQILADFPRNLPSVLGLEVSGSLDSEPVQPCLLNG